MSETTDTKRVLVIEDDETVARLLVELLDQEGYEPVLAADGLEGLLKLRTSRFDLALLDIMMPDVDGTRLLEQMLEEGDGQLGLPVIVVTGSPAGAAESRRVLGPEHVFEKPFEPAALMARVNAALRGPADA